MGAGHRSMRGGHGASMPGYSALLALGLVASAPWWLLRMATSQRYREGLSERLGRVPDRLRAAAAGRRVVWVHAVSVGEVLAVSRLVKELEATLNDYTEEPTTGAAERTRSSDDRKDSFEISETLHPMGSGEDGPWRVLISTTTRTGQALARERFGAARVFYFPLDFAWAVRAYLRALRPALVVLAESEIWPRLLTECERGGVPVAVVNARVSDRSFGRGMWVRGVWGRVLRKVCLWLAQSREDARRLVKLGAGADKVRVSGNLKFDVRAPNESRIAELIKIAAEGRPIIVAGSTSGGLNDSDPDEEGWLITAWGGRAKNELGALLVLAPRHPERFQQVWEDCIDFPSIKASELLADQRVTTWGAQKEEGGRPDILLLDTIGDLAAVYKVADLAFVGGSLITRGGHNPLEPAQFGVPVLIGPSSENFREIVAKLRAADAISITMGEAQGPKEKREPNGLFRPAIYAMRDSLETEMVRLLHDRQTALAMGERGRQVYLAEQGATERTVFELVSLIQSTPCTTMTAGQAVVSV